MDDRVLTEIGRRYDKTAAQVALRWVTGLESVSTVPKSTSRDHLRQNLKALDFELTEAECEAIARPSYAKSAKLFLRNEMGI